MLMKVERPNPSDPRRSARPRPRAVPAPGVGLAVRRRSAGWPQVARRLGRENGQRAFGVLPAAGVGLRCRDEPAELEASAGPPKPGWPPTPRAGVASVRDRPAQKRFALGRRRNGGRRVDSGHAPTCDEPQGPAKACGIKRLKETAAPRPLETSGGAAGPGSSRKGPVRSWLDRSVPAPKRMPVVGARAVVVEKLVGWKSPDGPWAGYGRPDRLEVGWGDSGFGHQGALVVHQDGDVRQGFPPPRLTGERVVGPHDLGRACTDTPRCAVGTTLAPFPRQWGDVHGRVLGADGGHPGRSGFGTGPAAQARKTRGIHEGGCRSRCQLPAV